MKGQYNLSVKADTQLIKFRELIILLKVFSVITAFVVTGVISMFWGNLLKNVLAWFIGD